MTQISGVGSSSDDDGRVDARAVESGLGDRSDGLSFWAGSIDEMGEVYRCRMTKE